MSYHTARHNQMRPIRAEGTTDHGNRWPVGNHLATFPPAVVYTYASDRLRQNTTCQQWRSSADRDER
jgi:hypothetical protein